MSRKKFQRLHFRIGSLNSQPSNKQSSSFKRLTSQLAFKSKRTALNFLLEDLAAQSSCNYCFQFSSSHRIKGRARSTRSTPVTMESSSRYDRVDRFDRSDTRRHRSRSTDSEDA